MAKIRLALYKLLQASDGPISLAQLPQYIKPYLNSPLDITKLGFTKLKDIILSFGDDFKIEVKSNNYPFVSLRGKAPSHSNSMAYSIIKSNPQQYYSDDFNWANNKVAYCPVIDFNKCLSTIRFQILKALQDFQDGIDSSTLYSILITQFNNYLNVSQFGCYSFEEFLERYLSADLELTYNKATQSCRVKIRGEQANITQRPVHYKFDTNPSFMEKSPQRSQLNSLDMSEGSLAGQVTYKFVDQLDITSNKFYGALNSGTVTPHRNISFWNISTRSSADFGMMHGSNGNTAPQEVDEYGMADDPELKKLNMNLMELIDESDKTNSPFANVIKQ